MSDDPGRRDEADAGTPPTPPPPPAYAPPAPADPPTASYPPAPSSPPPAYAPPAGYGTAPGAAAPAYPGTPYGAAAPRPQSGALAWGLAFLAYLPIPLISFLITAIVLTAVYRSVSRGGAVARENARHAVNWAWTAVLALVVSLLLTGILASTIAGDTRGLIAIFGVTYIAVGILYPVLAIGGLVKASRGRALTVPFAIPFIRR